MQGHIPPPSPQGPSPIPQPQGLKTSEEFFAALQEYLRTEAKREMLASALRFFVDQQELATTSPAGATGFDPLQEVLSALTPLLEKSISALKEGFAFLKSKGIDVSLPAILNLPPQMLTSAQIPALTQAVERLFSLFAHATTLTQDNKKSFVSNLEKLFATLEKQVLANMESLKAKKQQLEGEKQPHNMIERTEMLYMGLAVLYKDILAGKNEIIQKRQVLELPVLPLPLQRPRVGAKIAPQHKEEAVTSPQRKVEIPTTPHRKVGAEDTPPHHRMGVEQPPAQPQDIPPPSDNFAQEVEDALQAYMESGLGQAKSAGATLHFYLQFGDFTNLAGDVMANWASGTSGGFFGFGTAGNAKSPPFTIPPLPTTPPTPDTGTYNVLQAQLVAERLAVDTGLKNILGDPTATPPSPGLIADLQTMANKIMADQTLTPEQKAQFVGPDGSITKLQGQLTQEADTFRHLQIMLDPSNCHIDLQPDGVTYKIVGGDDVLNAEQLLQNGGPDPFYPDQNTPGINAIATTMSQLQQKYSGLSQEAQQKLNTLMTAIQQEFGMSTSTLTKFFEMILAIAGRIAQA